MQFTKSGLNIKHRNLSNFYTDYPNLKLVERELVKLLDYEMM